MAIARNAKINMSLFFFISGTTMATNIPYIASPMALITDALSTFPRTAPMSVPKVHPTKGSIISPPKKLEVTLFFVLATANISSVIRNPIPSFFLLFP